MRKLLLVVFMLAAVSAWAADVTGKWEGTLEVKREGETRTLTAYVAESPAPARDSGILGRENV